MALRRSVRKRYDQMDALATRARSRIVKAKERARRDARMAEKIKVGSLPYTPAVMSWLSSKLDKKSTRITQDDVRLILG